MKQGAYWTDPANQVVWGWVERYHVGIGGWGENIRVRVEDRKEAWELVPERTCKVNMRSEHDANIAYFLSCGHVTDWELEEPPAYCPECGAKVVEA